MPQITKIRIVNVSYNNGHRLIPDELYDLTSEDGTKALNTLFNLYNGGGKSVLVQFLMQPVLPNARASGRRITEFFEKPADHCFVVLEWKLDDSAEKLLTGIAMAGSTGNEDTRGTRIRYYTFMTTYTGSSRYDIVHLNLSARKNNRFVPAEFEDVRKWALASNGILQHYSRDDRSKWKEKLKEYGIYQTIWDKVVQQVNAEEGGMINFFDNIGTSEKLISKFFIPAIDARVTDGVENTDDASLKTMLMNYAQRRYSQDEMIRRRDLAQTVLQKTGELHEQADALFDLNDACHEAEKRALSYFYGIQAASRENQKEQEDLQKQAATITEEIRHIRYEEASAAYYKAEEAHAEALQIYQQAEQHQEEIRIREQKAQSDVELLQCARYLQEERKAEASRSSIQSQIDELQGKSDRAAELNDLKYTVHARTEELLPSARAEAKQIEASIKEKENRTAELSDEIRKKKNEIEDQRSAVQKEQGRLDGFREETDRIVNDNSMPFSRQLDDLYHQEHILRYIEDLETGSARYEKKAEKLQTSLDKALDEYHSLPAEIADTKNQLKLKKGSLEDALEEQKKYEHFVAQALEIGREFNAVKEDVLSGHLEQLVRQKLSLEQSSYAFDETQIEKKNREKEAAQKGTLHLLEEAVPLLNASGIAFETGEHYLLHAADMTPGRRQDLLREYPSLPYWLIVDTEKDLQALKSNGQGNEWLPSVIPMMTRSALTGFLDGTAVLPEFMSLYSRLFFEDPEGFIEDLDHEISSLRETQKTRQDRIEMYSDQVDLLHGSRYDALFEDGLKNRVDKLNNEISGLEGTLKDLEKQEASCKEKMDSLKDQIRQNEEAKQAQLKRIETARTVLNRVQSEASFTQKLEKDREQLKQGEDQLRQYQEENRKLDAELNTLQSQKQESDHRLNALEEAFSATAKAEEGDLRQGDWQTLYQQYQELQEEVSTDLEALQKRWQKANDQYEDYRKLLALQDRDPSTYAEIVYSEASEQKANQLHSRLRAELEQAQNRKAETGRKESALKNSLENALNDVHDLGEDPLPKSEIGSDFRTRLKDHDDALQSVEASIRKADGIRSMLENAASNAKKLLNEIHIPEEVNVMEIPLERNALDDLQQKVERQLTDSRRKLREAEQDMCSDLRDCISTYQEADQDILHGFRQILEVIGNQTEGDRYYTAGAQLGEMQHSLSLLISKLDADLHGIADDRTHLIGQCMQQGRTVYENLLEIADSSKVNLEENMPKKQMITMSLPDRKKVNPEKAEQLISEEIDHVTNEMREMLIRNDQASYEKAADKAVSSINLLHLYTDQKEISVKVYKIDFDVRNSSYRTWEKAKTENSGAEKFVAYFTAVLALMRYTGNSSGLGKENSSVLILDNPFGQITSAHLLNPTFRIAEHFHVQMICFSDITKAEVVNCFDDVIRLVIREQPGSSISTLTHEGNEKIEHGYYKSYRQSLF